MKNTNTEERINDKIEALRLDEFLEEASRLTTDEHVEAVILYELEDDTLEIFWRRSRRRDG